MPDPGKTASLLLPVLNNKTGISCKTLAIHPVGGGSINSCSKVVTDRGDTFFLKENDSARYPGLFQKEKEGLEYLQHPEIFRIPDVIAAWEQDNRQWLLLEWIEEGLKTESFWKMFGENLAAMHRVTRYGFGFQEDNFMGALPQQNPLTEAWTDFFICHRMQPQADLARAKGLLDSRAIALFESLYKKLDSIFTEEAPSLLHGDLWSGNFMCDRFSRPVLIDPAVYFGHRNMDLAMTTLFGGFDKTFYESYHYHFPLPGNYREQWDICNLYPLLIHLNLFGAGYLQDILHTLNRYA